MTLITQDEIEKAAEVFALNMFKKLDGYTLKEQVISFNSFKAGVAFAESKMKELIEEKDRKFAELNNESINLALRVAELENERKTLSLNHLDLYLKLEAKEKEMEGFSNWLYANGWYNDGAIYCNVKDSIQDLSFNQLLTKFREESK